MYRHKRRRLRRLLLVPVAIAVIVAGWLGVAALDFLTNPPPGEPTEVKQSLAGGSNLLFGSNVLVLGSDARDTGVDSGTNSRSDSIMLIHASLGNVRRLSVLRDSYAPIPGHEPQKINAAYAFGGPALTVQAVEGFLGNGLKVNHLIELNFNDFPELIDSVGGIDINLPECIQSPPFQGRVVSLSPGGHHLNGTDALAFSRVRKNQCNPGEDDRARVARQQMVLQALQAKLTSPQTLTHLPNISAKAPHAIRTDMTGAQLMNLAVDFAAAGSSKTEVLQPYSPGGGPGGSALVSDSERQQAVKRLIGH